jgi:hypothetical protein
MAAKRTVGTTVGLLAIVTALLAGCATVTPYQPRAFSGGYQERLVGPNRWYVEFFGNGHTTRETVTAYWLYRCAEVTQEKGFDYFVFIAKTPPPGAAAEPTEETETKVLARGGGGYVPIYTFVPGQTITTWSARGVIELRKGEPSPSDETRSHVAKELLSALAPAVREAMAAGKNVKLPTDYQVANEERPAAPQPPGAAAVKLEDLDALLPKE